MPGNTRKCVGTASSHVSQRGHAMGGNCWSWGMLTPAVPRHWHRLGMLPGKGLGMGGMQGVQVGCSPALGALASHPPLPAGCLMGCHGFLSPSTRSVWIHWMNSLILSPSERASQPNAGPSCSKSPVASSRARSRAGFFAITHPWGFTDFPGQVALVAPEESFRPSGYYFFAKRQVTSLRCIGLAFSRLKVLVLLIIIHQSRSLSRAGGTACKQEEQMTAQWRRFNDLFFMSWAPGMFSLNFQHSVKSPTLFSEGHQR